MTPIAIESDFMSPLNHERDIFVNTNVMQKNLVITNVNSIAERLKQARDKMGLTQIQLAAKAGVSQGAIGNLEKGTRKRPRDLVSIARALNVDPLWLESGKSPNYSTHLPTALNSEDHHNIRQTGSCSIEQALSTLETALTQLDMAGRERIAPMFESFARSPGAVIKSDIATLLVGVEDTKSAPNQKSSLVQKTG